MNSSENSLGGLPLDHVAIAVHSIAESLPLFESLTGATGSPIETVATQGVRVVFVGEGPGKLELLEPIDGDSPVAKFLAKRGQGIHHIAYYTREIQAELDRLDAAGFSLIDRAPRPGAHGHRVAFLHPKSTGGVLVELVG